MTHTTPPNAPAATPAAARQPVPPIGGFQDLDGRRVFLHRLGNGGPAAVFLPGSGAVGLDYLTVAQGVSQFAAAVVYDRGGTGYSDPLPLPLPRTAAEVAAELHELLHAQDFGGSYVLVAHSLGGAYAHRFTQLYPGEVAGLVWVDGFHRDWADFMPAAASRQPAPEPEQIRQMGPVLRAMYAELLADYPEELRQPLIDAHVSEEWLRVGSAERSNLSDLADELRCGPELPDVPLIALTADSDDSAPQLPMARQTMRAMREGMRGMADAMVSTVSFGEHRIVADVGHNQLCFSRPDAVVRAIRDVVERVDRA